MSPTKHPTQAAPRRPTRGRSIRRSSAAAAATAATITAAPPIHVSRLGESPLPKNSAHARSEPERASAAAAGIGATPPAVTKPLQRDDLNLTPTGETPSNGGLP